MAKYCHTIKTDWGYLAAVWSDSGLWELTFPFTDEAAALSRLGTKDALPGEMTAEAAELAQELKVYFSGYPVQFSAPIDWRGYTPFQAAVLRHTCSIPCGVTESYGQVAAAIGSPKASRAVGGALHINRTPIVVPCHRVIGSSGKLVGFGGGLELKDALLLLERETARV